MTPIRRNVLIAVGAASMALTFGVTGASGQGMPVGTPGEPQCHGERVAAGNQRVVDIPELALENFRLTPEGRTDLLNAFQEDGRTDWTVRDFQERVRTSCEAP
jgi:hypothetical protein